MEIREAQPDDAGVVISLFERLYSETSFLLYEPNEKVPKIEEYARRIGEARKAKSGVMYLAKIEGETVGVIFGNRGAARRNWHSLFLVLGVLQAYWNRGVGLSLLRVTEHWASTQGLHRLELTVQKRNTRAVALYEKAGFEVEGTKRHSLVVNGAFLDEWFMSKLIDAQPRVAAVVGPHLVRQVSAEEQPCASYASGVVSRGVHIHRILFVRAYLSAVLKRRGAF